MDLPMSIWLFGFLMLAIVTYIVVATLRGGKKPHLVLMAAGVPSDSQAATPTDPPLSGTLDDVKSTQNGTEKRATPEEKKSQRESRADVITARVKAGECIYCQDPAWLPQPVLVPQMSFWDRLYRRLNVVSLNRYRLLLKRDTDIKPEVCHACYMLVLGRKERETIDVASDMASYFDKQRLRVYIFERYGCDEAVLADVLEARQAKLPNRRKQRELANNDGKILTLAKPANGG
jgi:hypothetical protein